MGSTDLLRQIKEKGSNVLKTQSNGYLHNIERYKDTIISDYFNNDLFKSYYNLTFTIDEDDGTGNNIITKKFKESLKKCILLDSNHVDDIIKIRTEIGNDFISVFQNEVLSAIDESSDNAQEGGKGTNNVLGKIRSIMEDTAISYAGSSLNRYDINNTSTCGLKTANVFLKSKNCMVDSLLNSNITIPASGKLAFSTNGTKLSPASIAEKIAVDMLNKTLPNIMCNEIVSYMVQSGNQDAGLNDINGADLIVAMLNSKVAMTALNKIPGVKAEFFKDFILGSGSDGIDGTVSKNKKRLGLLFELFEQFFDPSAHGTLSLDNVNMAYGLVQNMLRALQYLTFIGSFATWLGFILSLYQVFAFMKRIHWIGTRQLETIETYFDPIHGYNKVIASNSLTLNDLALIRGSYFSKREIRFLLLHTSASYQNKSRLKIEKSNIVLQRYIAKSLRYRSLSSSTMFLGAYPFCAFFGFVLNSILLFVVCSVVFIPLFVIFKIPNWYEMFKNEIFLLMPLVVLAIARAITLACIKKRVGIEVASHAGPSHIGGLAMYDGIFTLVSAIVGFAPAITRIIGTIIVGVIKVSRLDTRLSYTELDPAHGYFSGVLEEMRMRAEYRVKARVFEMKHKRQSSNRAWAPNPLNGVDDTAVAVRDVKKSNKKYTSLEEEGGNNVNLQQKVGDKSNIGNLEMTTKKSYKNTTKKEESMGAGTIRKKK